jgi:pimeloyl-ACP methyl ester carboxylesterase
MAIAADMLYWHNDFCAALVDNGFQVVRLDNRDSGESTHLDGPAPPTVAGYAGSPIPRPTGWRTWPMTPPRSSTHSTVISAVVGHSMGGMIAQPARSVTLTGSGR